MFRQRRATALTTPEIFALARYPNSRAGRAASARPPRRAVRRPGPQTLRAPHGPNSAHGPATPAGALWVGEGRVRRSPPAEPGRGRSKSRRREKQPALTPHGGARSPRRLLWYSSRDPSWADSTTDVRMRTPLAPWEAAGAALHHGAAQRWWVTVIPPVLPSRAPQPPQAPGRTTTPTVRAGTLSGFLASAVANRRRPPTTLSTRHASRLRGVRECHQRNYKCQHAARRAVRFGRWSPHWAPISHARPREEDGRSLFSPLC